MYAGENKSEAVSLTPRHEASPAELDELHRAPLEIKTGTSLRRMPFSFMMYASYSKLLGGRKMAAKTRLKRKSYFVDERALSRAKKALGVKTEAEVIRLSVERVAEMEEFWEFMKKTRRSLKPGSMEKP
jgi:hypothetical protein